MPQGATVHSHKLTTDHSTLNFDKSRWARLDGTLARSVDRSRYELGELHDEASLLADQILSSVKVGPSNPRTALMQKVATEAMNFLATQRGVKLQAMKEEALYSQGTAELIYRLFDQLQACVMEFNRLVGWNELRVTLTKPAVVTEVLRRNKFREPIETLTNFRTRLSTRYMSLVIRGRGRSIDFIFMPVEKVIGLSKAEVAYDPVISLTGTIEQGRISWHLEGKSLPGDGLEILCSELFAELIELTKQASRSEMGAI